jgi:hypothetical protein
MRYWLNESIASKHLRFFPYKISITIELDNLVRWFERISSKYICTHGKRYIKTTADSSQININVTFLFCQVLYRDMHYIEISKASFSVHMNDRNLFTCKKLLVQSLSD